MTTSVGAGAGGVPVSVTSGVTTGADAAAATAGVGVTTGAGGCTPGSIPAGTLRGTVTYNGSVGASDVLRVFALKNFQPDNVAGKFEFSAPAFPLSYEITGLSTDSGPGTFYGVLAYLDIDGDNPTSPGDADPRGLPAMIALVSECSGATLDVAIH